MKNTTQLLKQLDLISLRCTKKLESLRSNNTELKWRKPQKTSAQRFDLTLPIRTTANIST